MGDEAQMLATATIAGTSPAGGSAVVLTIDLSQSTILDDVSPESCGGDVNGDGLYDTYLDCEITAATLVVEQMAAMGHIDEVAVVFFEKLTAAADLSPASGVQTFVDPAADADNDSVLDVVEVLRSMQWYTTGTFTRFAGPSIFTSVNAGEHNGGTAIAAGLVEACDVLGGSAAADQRIVLFTDGHNNKLPHLEDALPCTPNIPVYAFGLGPDGECTDGSEATFGELATHVPYTGGECFNVTSVYTLPDVLEGFLTPVVTEARVVFDSGTPITLTTGVTPALPYEGFGEIDLSWLAEGLVDEHQVCFELDVEVGEAEGTIGDCVALELNEAPTLALGADLVVDEGDLVSLDLSGAVDPDGDPLHTIWEVSTLDGPALAAPSDGQQAASWVPLDDGEYTITLTVDDGLATATDGLTLRVRNEAPGVTWAFHDGVSSGVVSLAGQVHDPGLLDVPSIEVDWGDGEVELLDPAAQGPGWSAFVAGHAYAAAGSYDVMLTVDDHDGGVFVDLASASVAPPVAVWAGGTVRKALEWSGCSGSITGLIHSNQDVWLGGGGKAVDGAIESVTGTHLRGDITLSETPGTGVAGPSPVQFDLTQWRPGGTKAVAYGEAWHNRTADCTSGTWTVDAALAPGVYYADCDIVIHTSEVLPVSFIAEGRVELAADGATIDSFGDALAILSASTADDAVDISGGSATIHGYLAAPAGGVEVGGELLTLYCGVVADRVDLAGSGLVLNADVCSSVAPTNVTPVLMPGLTVTLATEPAHVLPTEVVTATATVRFDEAWLVVPAVVGVQNLGDAAITVDDLEVTLSAPTGAGGAWESLLVPVSWEAAALGTGPALSGAEVAAQAKQYWSVEVVADATGADLTALMAAAAAGEVRAELSLVLDNPTSEPVRLLGSSTGLVLSPAGDDVDEASVVLLLTDGTARVIGDGDDPALTALEVDEAVELTVPASPPALAPIGGAEADGAYVERLLAADGSTLRTQAFAMGTFAGRPVPGARVQQPTTLDVPALRLLGPVAPTEGAAGDVLDVGMTVSHVSQTEAVLVSGTRSVGTTSLPPALTTPLDPGAVTDAPATHTLAEAVAGSTVSVVREVQWQDGAGNLYGPLSLSSTITVEGLPALALTLADSLYTDADSNGVITEGDTVRLQAVVRAGPSAGLTDIEVVLPLEAGLTLTAASATVGSWSSSTVGDVTTVTFSVGNLSANGTANVEVRFVVPTASEVHLTHQAEASSTEVASVLSDDPQLPGHTDPTTTRVIGTDAELEAWLGWRLLTDIDGNGVPSPGDTIRYEGALSNSGLETADAVVLTIPVDPGGTLVAGTAWVSTGTVDSGSLSTDAEVELAVGDVASLVAVTWRYDVSVGFLASLVGDMTTQGQLTLGLDPAGSTDDPRTEAAGDETVIAVSTTPYPDRTGYAGPYPTVSFVSPEPGARVGVPTDIVATVAPTEGEDVVYWRAIVWEDGLDLEPVVLAYGLTDPPAPPSALATLDTTLLRNGLYTVRVEVIDSAGLMGWADAPLEVAGDFKPGSMRVAFVDGSYALPVGGDIRVVRVYDNLSRHVRGDFGYGWHLELLGMRIQTNGPLGEGGWGQEPCGAGMFYGTQCFTAARPHLVVLTWPDGRQESWDFLPEPVSSYFNALAVPGFVPRAGTTSSLAVAAGTGTGFFVAEDGNIYTGLAGEGGYYEPAAYVVTTPDGMRYDVGAADGLRVITDRFGNTTTFDEEGITASLGPDLQWERDGQGRITAITFPDDSTVGYAYTVHGDLDVVTDQLEDDTEHAYEGDHRLVSYHGEGRPAAAVWTYDEDGRVVATEDGEGVGTELADFDLETLTVTTVGPDPALTTVEAYGAEGLLVSVTQSFGAESYVTSHEYDSEYRVVSTTWPNGGEEAFEYDGTGRVTSHTDTGGTVTRITFNTRGEVLRVEVDGEETESSIYDVEGHLLSVSRGGTTTNFGYTDHQLTSVTTPDGTVALSYDSHGYPDSATFPNGQQMSVTRDAAGRVLSQTRPGRGTIHQTWDAAGHLLTLTDERGRTQSWTWDSSGNPVSYKDKLDRDVVMTWDDAGRLASITDRNGQLTTLTYDTSGRVLAVSAGAVTRSATYDALGREVEVTEGDATVTRVWSAVGLVSEVIEYGMLDPMTRTWSYDASGRLIASSDPWGTVSYGYDGAGRLVDIIDAEIGGFGIEWDVLGRQTSLTRPGGIETATSHDDVGRVLSMLTEVGTTPVHTLAWGYAADGLPSTRTDGLGVHQFAHDVAGRLVEADHPPGGGLLDEVYTYDGPGRRTSWADNPAGQVVYDEGDRLVQDAVWLYTWDHEGQRTTRTARFPADTAVAETWTYSWDGFGRLEGVTSPGEETWTYGYDAFDRRVRVTGPTGTRWYVYDGDLVVAVLDGDGNLIERYVTGVGFGEVLASVSGEDVRYAVRDSLGSVVAWLDEDGDVVEYVYRDAYGRRVVAAEETEPWGYTGHAEDGNGLVWGRARYYEPETGQWLREDFVWTTPRYSYGNNSPCSQTDPTGLVAVSYTKDLKQASCRGIKAATTGTGNIHHVATNKHAGRTPAFATLFSFAGMTLNDAANLVYVYGHFGPHPAAYHDYVSSRIQAAFAALRARTEANYRSALKEVLNDIAVQAKTPCSQVNKWLTE